MRCSSAFTNNIYVISRIWRISLLWILLMPIPIRYSLKVHEQNSLLTYNIHLSLCLFLSLRIENHYEYYTYPNPLSFSSNTVVIVFLCIFKFRYLSLIFSVHCWIASTEFLLSQTKFNTNIVHRYLNPSSQNGKLHND